VRSVGSLCVVCVCVCVDALVSCVYMHTVTQCVKEVCPNVREFKPQSSRKESRETFIYATHNKKKNTAGARH
jgi:23S rRNA U2552 (ribose-2'-O)-methylase RlmE/FtsJ